MPIPADIASSLAKVGLKAVSRAAVFHEVNFRFRPDLTQSQVDEIVSRYASLKTLSVNPETNKPLIQSFKFGVNNSPEGLNKGFNYIFQLKFANAADRDYFVGQDHTKPFDPQHDAFKKFVGPLLDGGANGVMVVDFQDHAVLSSRARAAASAGSTSPKP